MIGDNTERIAQVIREAMQRCQIIITTGGLGPTVDDPTRAAVALALDVDTEFRPELWEQIQARFQRYGRAPSENNRRQAWIPAGAIPVENPVGTAPSFICETINACIISLPGVPREMEYLTQNVVIPYLRERFQLTGTIKARVLHVAGVGESQVDEWIGDLETNPNPTVGLLAHPGQVDVRITAKANSMAEADRMIAEMEARVRERITGRPVWRRPGNPGRHRAAAPARSRLATRAGGMRAGRRAAQTAWSGCASRRECPGDRLTPARWMSCAAGRPSSSEKCAGRSAALGISLEHTAENHVLSPGDHHPAGMQRANPLLWRRASALPLPGQSTPAWKCCAAS